MNSIRYDTYSLEHNKNKNNYFNSYFILIIILITILIIIFIIIFIIIILIIIMLKGNRREEAEKGMREITTNNNDFKSGHICLWRETGFARNEMGTDPAEWMEFKTAPFPFGVPLVRVPGSRA